MAPRQLCAEALAALAVALVLIGGAYWVRLGAETATACFALASFVFLVALALGNDPPPRRPRAPRSPSLN